MFFLSCINQLLKPNADFFSITFNDNEALLILDDHAKREFLPKNGTANAPGSGDQNDTESTFEFDSNSGGVRVSRVQWTVLSLDVSRSPARLRKIADSMQSSSIPVLYQSAMNCDYLFVRHLFSSQGVMTDRRQVPKIHLQRTLSVLSEEVGLVLSGDERPTHQGYSLGRDWEKSRSRKPKRRVRHPQNYDDHVASQSSSPSSSDISSSHQRGRSKVPSQAIQKGQTSTHLPPVRLLPHKMVFHGLNSGPHGDWLLKLVKMIGWPDSLLVPKAPKPTMLEQFGYVGRYPSTKFFPHGSPAINNERPRRPGFFSRHSDDAHTFPKGNLSRLKDLEYDIRGRQPGGNTDTQSAIQVQTTPRSRSTSYPDVLPDFYHTAKKPSLLPQPNGLLAPSKGPGFAPGLSPPAEHPPASCDEGVATKEEPPSTPSQSQLHMQTLPFFSLICRTRNQNDTEVSIMTRGSLLAQLFESSTLLGGSGDIAVSDSGEEDMCARRYTHGSHGGPTAVLNGSSKAHGRTSSIDEEPQFMKYPPSLGISPSGSRHSTQSGLDEGFKCLQVDLSKVDPSMCHSLPRVLLSADTDHLQKTMRTRFHSWRRR